MMKMMMKKKNMIGDEIGSELSEESYVDSD